MLDIIIYSDGELELNVSLKEETIWITQKQLCELFDRDKSVISRHLRNIFREYELDKNSVVAKNATTGTDGKVYQVEYYNLDVIISVGYRVNSQKATKFRQWATKVLTNYIKNGYAINEYKITQQRLALLENDISTIKSHINVNSLELKQGIFYNGQIFDAYIFVSNLIKNTKSNITLIDNYIDEVTLTLFSKNKNIKITIYTQNISKQLKLDIEKYDLL
jgi:prophage antirepressor-like protein